MEWTDWPIACWTLATLVALASRRWIDACWCACFALFVLVDRIAPAADAGPVKYGLFALGAVLVGVQVGKRYARYKKGGSMPRPKAR